MEKRAEMISALEAALTARGEKFDADSVGVHVTTTLQFDPLATADSILADWDQATEEAAEERARDRA